ncbi:MAG: cell division protein FtsX, partial [Bacilli bacterium]|nr:cell division protein FtsX [Bacilli bacterium]
MKPIRMLGRSVRDAVKSVIRNFSLSLASISCITITLIIVALAVVASFNVQNFTQAIEKDMTIVVFIDN